MAARKSSHDRLEKLRAEAAATETEKAEKAKAKPKPKAKAKPKAAPKKRTRAASKRKPPRMMVVWTVCTPKGEELETYPYARKAEAEAECRRLGTAKGTAYTLLRKRVPFEAPAPATEAE